MTANSAIVALEIAAARSEQFRELSQFGELTLLVPIAGSVLSMDSQAPAHLCSTKRQNALWKLSPPTAQAVPRVCVVCTSLRGVAYAWTDEQDGEVQAAVSCCLNVPYGVPSPMKVPSTNFAHTQFENPSLYGTNPFIVYHRIAQTYRHYFKTTNKKHTRAVEGIKHKIHKAYRRARRAALDATAEVETAAAAG